MQGSRSRRVAGIGQPRSVDYHGCGRSSYYRYRTRPGRPFSVVRPPQETRPTVAPQADQNPYRLGCKKVSIAAEIPTVHHIETFEYGAEGRPACDYGDRDGSCFAGQDAWRR
ncbi:hypothetical protein Vau01_085260 [Virgisporangium aurantiacum]|uniref:Uncharacterized protein n=1 Tax=Virgisporangium aurantiacum TaxID=175570 RepID=A0A8J3ZG67_9ACTN|nr:hypothetical protein Vau01_085260 [Virgisporangium aurantiacum]